MKQTAKKYSIIAAALAMLVLILDSKTALHGAIQGVNACIYNVIPSLFPFFVISIYMTESLTGKPLQLIYPIARLCGVPRGGESLLTVGLIGGYPVGAHCIWEHYNQGLLNKKDAHRLMGFCSNAGPAFIFGMMSNLFTSPAASWLLWIIHMVSAVIVGAILPGKINCNIKIPLNRKSDFTQVIRKSISALAGVCGWVILFRMLQSYLSVWIFWIMPIPLQAVVTGVLELVNGSIMLHRINSELIRFILSCGMLSFGGLCVLMQTRSVTKDMGTGMYFQGKLMQTLISLILSCFACYLLYPGNVTTITKFLLPLVLIIGLHFIIKSIKLKKTVAITG